MWCEYVIFEHIQLYPNIFVRSSEYTYEYDIFKHIQYIFTNTYLNIRSPGAIVEYEQICLNKMEYVIFVPRVPAARICVEYVRISTNTNLLGICIFRD